jgi:peptide/nickel transport system permease protein
MIIVGPSVAPFDPNAVALSDRLLSPSATHLFGTDSLGRDVLSRVLYGARLSLPTGVVVVLIGALIGTSWGGIAAYAGGWIEEGMMRVTDVFLAFPALILAMAIAAALGIGVISAVGAMVVVWWPSYARLARSLVIVQRDQDYVLAARVLGYSPARILVRHILPNATGPLIVLMTLDVGNAILTFSGLSFLGLGVVPPTAEWGAMISAGRLLITQWWVATFPGLAIVSVVLAFNFLGDGIRDWLDPRARRR